MVVMRLGWLLVLAAASGRIGFDQSTNTSGDGPVTGSDARGSDAAANGSDGSGGGMGLAWEQAFAGHVGSMSSNTDTFTAQAKRSDDAIAIVVFCDSQAVNTIAVTAPGWSFRNLGGVSGNPWGSFETLGAIAPNTQAATFTVTVTTTSGTCSEIIELADEFSGNADDGGTMTFDDVNQAGGASGTCNDSISTGHAGDVVWAACIASCSTNSPASGYTRGAMAGTCAMSEYKLTSDPINTNETPSFTSNVTNWSMGAVTIRTD